nr:MAG TPA: hypothetical protein [Ackermannviridae sp.]
MFVLSVQRGLSVENRGHIIINCFQVNHHARCGFQFVRHVLCHASDVVSAHNVSGAVKRLCVCLQAAHRAGFPIHPALEQVLYSHALYACVNFKPGSPHPAFRKNRRIARVCARYQAVIPLNVISHHVSVFGGLIHKAELLQALVTVQVQEREALRHLVVQHNAFDLARRYSGEDFFSGHASSLHNHAHQRVHIPTVEGHSAQYRHINFQAVVGNTFPCRICRQINIQLAVSSQPKRLRNGVFCKSIHGVAAPRDKHIFRRIRRKPAQTALRQSADNFLLHIAVNAPLNHVHANHNHPPSKRMGAKHSPAPIGSVPVAAIAAFRQRIVKGLCGGGGSRGHVRNHLRVEGGVRVVHDGVITAATALGFQLDFLGQAVAHSGNVLTGQHKAVLGFLVVHSLRRLHFLNAAQPPVNVLVHFQRLLVVVGIRITQRNVGFQLCVLLHEIELVPVDRLVLAALGNTPAVQRHGPKATYRVQRAEGSSDNARGQSSVCHASGCITHFHTVFSFRLVRISGKAFSSPDIILHHVKGVKPYFLIRIVIQLLTKS